MSFPSTVDPDNTALLGSSGGQIHSDACEIATGSPVEASSIVTP
jgi:hypothetical protein